MFFVKDLLKEDGTPVKSGETIEDVMETMLEEMYAMLNGKKNVEEEGVVRIADDDVSDGEDVVGTNPSGVTDSNRNDERPASWFFHGFMAVVIFGPFAPIEKRLTFFTTSDPLPANKKALNRKTAREEKKKRAATKRSLNANTSGAATVGERGLSVTEQVQLANLELQFGRFEKDRADAAVISLKFQADIVEKNSNVLFKKLLSLRISLWLTT